jgi:hypothetical protein
MQSINSYSKVQTAAMQDGQDHSSQTQLAAAPCGLGYEGVAAQESKEEVKL